MIQSFRGKYAFLSNFTPHKVTIDDNVFPTAEHAFASFKSTDPTWIAKCTDASITPSEIKMLGRRLHLRPDWDDIKLDVMHQVLKAKFTQNPKLGERLLATGDEQLIEGNTWGDTYWGVYRGTGKNHLGKLLMRVRAELILQTI